MIQVNIWKITFFPWKEKKKLKIIYLNCEERYEDMIDNRSYIHNLSSCGIKAWRKFRLQRDSNPWPPSWPAPSWLSNLALNILERTGVEKGSANLSARLAFLHSLQYGFVKKSFIHFFQALMNELPTLSTPGKAIGHFRDTFCLSFKTSLRAKPFLRKWVWFAWKWTCGRNSFSYEWFRT